MSTAKRKGLEFAINQIGNAFNAIENLVGDISTPDKPFLKIENTYVKLKGSTIFNDYDISKKDPNGILSSEFNTFDILESTELAIQGGNFVVKNDISNFSNFSTWNPTRYSPPSPEGWLIYDYNAWSNYTPKYDASGSANTNKLIYDIYGEPNSGLGRTAFNYPIRFTGFGNTYERVPLFEYANWISISNLGGTTVDEINIVVPKKIFGGAYNVDPYFNTPNDVLIMSHSNLKSTSLDDPITLAGLMGTIGISDKLEVLPFRIFECDENGFSNSDNVDFFKFDINLPTNYSWQEADFRHFVFYWGSNDDYIDELKLEYSRSNNEIDIHYSSFINSSYFVFPKKNFFDKNLKNTFTISKTGVNDTNLYLYNSDNSKYEFKESFYNDISIPFRYKLKEVIPLSSIGKTNSLSGYRESSTKQYIPFIIACKNNGLSYDLPNIDIEIFYGYPISLESIPTKWSDLPYYPDIPEDYIPLVKIIGKNSEINENCPYFLSKNNYFLNDISIIWIEMVVENSIQKSIGDSDISLFFGNLLSSFKDKITKKEYINFFSYIGQNLLTKFLHYNTNKIFNSNQFISLSSSEYKTLHALAKLPYDSLLQNENNIEPKAIQFNMNGANIISNFSQIPPSKNFAGLSSTTLYFNTEKLITDTEFEVYLEKNIDELNDRNDNNRGSEKDYSFKIKFSNTKNQYTIKNIFVNASQYYLTDLEYKFRKNKKLNLDGYFIKDTLKTIPEFNLNSYAGVIPDLKFEEYRTILNKFNNPLDSSRTTESDYENSLKTLNPSINKNQIIEQKIGFGLTDAFYVIDFNKPADTYNGIADLGITVTDYRVNQNPKWINNTLFLNDISNKLPILNADHIKDLRNDSFIISGAGFFITDNSIQELENRDNQRLLSSSTSSINQSSSIGSQKLKNKIAIKILCDERQKIKSFKIKLKKTSDIINKNAQIRAYIYTDKQNLPDKLLATGSSVYLKDIDEKFQDFYFEIDHTFYEDKLYWIVLETDQLPPEYDPFNFGLINVIDTLVTGLYDGKTNKITNFKKYLLGAELGIGNTVGTAISNWYPITSIGSSFSMTVASTGQSLFSKNYSVRYTYDIAIKETSSIGASQNLAYNSSTGWTSYEGTAFIEFHKPETEIYASLNRDYTKSNLILPPPNLFREVGTNKEDGFWSYNCKQFFNDKKLYIYPRSIYLQKNEIVGSGNSQSNIININSYDFDEKIISGLALSNSTYYSAGTSITNIIYDSTNDLYKLYLSSNLLSNFSNSIIGIGTNYNSYVKRANDINIILKYKKYSGIAVTQITLEKSPTWITYWQNSNKIKYRSLSKNLPADYITASYNLNFYNKDFSNYIIGYTIGDFNVRAGIGTSFDFRFYSSGGLKVFLNDAKTPVINRWTKTNSMIGATFSTSIGSTLSKVKLEVHFNNNKLVSGAGQTLIGQWKISGTSQWQNIDESFYLDKAVEPVLIDSDDIQSIIYMSCSNNNNIFQSANLNSPINDRLVIRSK